MERAGRDRHLQEGEEAMSREPIFGSYSFGDQERSQMDSDGHFAFPGLLTESTQKRLTDSLAHIESLKPMEVEGYKANQIAAELDEYLESLIGHPQMLTLARQILGDEVRYDHCAVLNRAPGFSGMRWHTHSYSDDDPSFGFVRIFFYVNGFAPDDGGLKVVPGSHHFRIRGFQADSDEELKAEWLTDKVHPTTREPLSIQQLTVPAGTVIVLWTHAAHGVNPRPEGSDTRWTVVYAYRNPGKPSRARWITPGFEQKSIQGAEGLMGLY